MRPAEDDSWDAADFLELAGAAGRMAAGAGRLERALRRAEAAYTGPLFPEWPYERWSEPRQLEVAEALRSTLARLGEELAGAGSLRDAIACYERLTALEPEREAWHRALMTTYDRAGERALALRQYHACRKVLRGGARRRDQRRDPRAPPGDPQRARRLNQVGSPRVAGQPGGSRSAITAPTPAAPSGSAGGWTRHERRNRHTSRATAPSRIGPT